jgi:integrase
MSTIFFVASTERSRHGIKRAKAAGQRHRVLEAGELQRLWRLWGGGIHCRGTPLHREQFKLRVLTGQRGGEVLHMLWSAIDLDAGLWIKALQFRKRKPTDTRQDPHLVPLALMAVGILRRLKDYHERELAPNNKAYGGTWNGKKYGSRARRSRRLDRRFGSVWGLASS